MKTLLAYIMLLGGCNALHASDRNPTKLETTAAGLNKQVQVFLVEKKAGIIKLKCLDQQVQLNIYNKAHQLVFGKSFGAELLEVNVSDWEEGSYTYEVIKENVIVKSGSIKVNN